jgi:hypothetical protein
MADWSTPVTSLTEAVLTWDPPQFGEVIDFEGIRVEFAIQYVVAYQSGDNFLVSPQGSLDGEHWYPFPTGSVSLGVSASAAGVSVQVAHLDGTPARYVRMVGDNRNTGAPVATTLVASAR